MANTPQRARLFSAAGRIGKLAVAAACSASGLALAAEALVLGGVEGGSRTSYVYAGTILPTPVDGLVQKYWIDHQTYSYKSGNQGIDARVYGLEAALGYQKASTSGWIGAYAGFRFSDTRLSPDVPTSRVRGEQFRPKVQLDGQQDFGVGWRVGAIASYVFEDRGYWTRLRLQHRVSDGVYFGPEVIAQGDRDYRGVSGGLALTGIRLGQKVQLGVHAGVKKIEGESQDFYAGVELGGAF